MGLGLVCFLCIMLSSYGFTSRIPQSCIEWRARGPSASFGCKILSSSGDWKYLWSELEVWGTRHCNSRWWYTTYVHFSPAFVELRSGGIPSCIVHSLLWWVQGWYASCVSWFSSYGFTSHMHTSVLHLSVKHLVVIGEFMKWAWGLGYRKL